ncbi:hypothetical protein [Helicobacter salomonis]|uniref:hypothetical protein n=1 Tax=Helicobacter salomonis TaxID=56878 RepID=UPI000CF18E54|nr:hypothetical protein [Helicobacter salomonis]
MTFYLNQASKEATHDLKEVYTTAYKDGPDSFVETLAQSVPNLSFAQYVVGGIAGGLAGTKIGKSLMDKFIEDDSVKIYRLFFGTFSTWLFCFVWMKKKCRRSRL